MSTMSLYEEDLPSCKSPPIWVSTELPFPVELLFTTKSPLLLQKSHF
jgi:hypothetical protein